VNSEFERDTARTDFTTTDGEGFTTDYQSDAMAAMTEEERAAAERKRAQNRKKRESKKR